MKQRNMNRIVLYNRAWGMKSGEYNYPVTENFHISTDHKYLDEAVAVIFHMPTLQQNDPAFSTLKKKEGQLWVFWSMECEAHYKWQYTPQIQDLFDIMVTYKLDADVPVPYFYSHYLDLLRQAPAPKTGLINAFISSTFDLSRRLQYLKELTYYINIHSYGKVFNNMELPDDEGNPTKERIIPGYKFSIAFENAIARDYVTEKFYQPLVAGSVPIYLGAPNIDEFCPGDHCYINVHDFGSMKELANYLLELDQDDARYGEYLEWKRLPFRNEFEHKTSIVSEAPILRICKLISEHLVTKEYLINA